jgi:molybdopterin/thiamine biosynthesis adenylyltransferase
VDDSQLLRYSRHILLPEIDIQGQEKLIRSNVLIIGAGGLGSPVALYLAASGIGKLTICDNDTVDLTNLQRQIIHHTNAIGTPKTHSAKNTIIGINPEVNVITLQEYVSENKLQELVPDADLVIDASDNFTTRHHINKTCVTYKKPLISGAAIGFEGQVTMFDPRLNDSPCYHCLFPIPTNSGEEEPQCSTMGVFSPLVGIIGCTQAAEAIKTLLEIGENLNGRLLLLNGLKMKWRSIKLNKDPACKVCNEVAPKNWTGC